MRKIVFPVLVMVIALVCLPTSGVFAQGFDTLRIATYNLLNYPGGSSSVRNPEFRKILRSLDPDILVVQEMQSSAGLSEFLNSVLNYGQPGTYSSAPFNDGPDSDNGLFFKPSKVAFIGPQTVLRTNLRDINGYRLRPLGINSDSLDIQIYSAHFKANLGEEPARFAEADTLRNHLNDLPEGSFIAAGDFNLYTSAEPAYQELIGSQTDNSGRLYDPINSPGDWHDGETFAAIHTQSTRSGNLGDGGATGGLDDRFDFVLLSYGFQSLPKWQYVPGSYFALGNDGNHFNQSVNAGTNYAVPDSIANALYFVSDHLPVMLSVRRQVSPPPSITVLSPNGGEVWYIGSPSNILWTSQGITGTVTIRLNRSFPNGSWETLFSGTNNDGLQSWTVSSPASESARIQIVSDLQPSISDNSDGDFALRFAPFSLVVPAGGEVWTIGQYCSLRWNTGGLGGNIRVELDRAFPSGNWEILLAATSNDGLEPWLVNGPASVQCRIRIWSLNQPSQSDTSDTDFLIRHPNLPPVIAHDLHGDALPGNVTVTARLTDDGIVADATLHYRSGWLWNSAEMSPTGYPDEFAATFPAERGVAHYYIAAVDDENAISRTDTLSFLIADTASLHLRYDDGTAESYQWAEPDSVSWAVKFTPASFPFALTSAEIAVAGFHPDSAHTPVIVQILDSDGPGGLPGTVLRTLVKGSVGNRIGGLPYPGTHWITAFLLSDSLVPLQLSSSFYVAVMNSTTPGEAFGLDTSSAQLGHSYVYDPCDMQWLEESMNGELARAGNRMIRIRGWTAIPPTVVLHRFGNQITLNWSETGAPYYIIYKSLTSDFANPERIAATQDTLFTVGSVDSAPAKSFFRIVSSNQL